jgi:hypothetical protein
VGEEEEEEEEEEKEEEKEVEEVEEEDVVGLCMVWWFPLTPRPSLLTPHLATLAATTRV